LVTSADRIRGLRQKIDVAREVLFGGSDQGLAANLRLYIAELELEIEQAQIAVPATSDKQGTDEADES